MTMPEDHSHACCTLSCVAMYVAPAVIVYYTLKLTGVFRYLQLKLQVKFMSTMGEKSNSLPPVISAKSELFKSLKDFKTPPTILEVGPGDCRNLEYFPADSPYIITEPNEYFHEPLKKRVSKVGAHLQLKGVHNDIAENLQSIKDESVDAYVLTHVMCSVKDVDAALQEAKRVLKPGGRLYIFHHFLGPNIKLRSPQALFERFILFPFFAGKIMECEYDRYVEADIRRYFPKTETKTMELPFKFITIRYHIISVSEK